MYTLTFLFLQVKSKSYFSAGLNNVEALRNFVWRVLVPLMRLTQSYNRAIVDKVRPKLGK